MTEFIECEWVFERSSGYAGYRNTINGDWIYEDDYNQRIEAIKQDELWGNVFAKIKQYGLNNEVLSELKLKFTITRK